MEIILGSKIKPKQQLQIFLENSNNNQHISKYMESGQHVMKVNFIALNTLVTKKTNQLFKKSTQETRK